jgi:hypothetical protein
LVQAVVLLPLLHLAVLQLVVMLLQKRRRLRRRKRVRRCNTSFLIIL